MTYLAAEFNSGDTAALHAVTTPASYLQLTQMWSGPVNLQLQSCKANGSRGDFYCYLSHDYPTTLNNTGQVVAGVRTADGRGLADRLRSPALSWCLLGYAL